MSQDKKPIVEDKNVEDSLIGTKWQWIKGDYGYDTEIYKETIDLEGDVYVVFESGKRIFRNKLRDFLKEIKNEEDVFRPNPIVEESSREIKKESHIPASRNIKNVYSEKDNILKKAFSKILKNKDLSKKRSISIKSSVSIPDKSTFDVLSTLLIGEEGFDTKDDVVKYYVNVIFNNSKKEIEDSIESVLRKKYGLEENKEE